MTRFPKVVVALTYRCRWVPVVKCPQCKQDMPADHTRHLAARTL